jgi:hypothetical protein
VTSKLTTLLMRRGKLGADLARAWARSEKAMASPKHKRLPGSVMNLCESGCPACVTQDAAWQRWAVLDKKHKQLMRELLSEQTAKVGERRAITERAGKAKSKQGEATRQKIREALERRRYTLNQRAIAAKIAGDVNLSARQVQAHLRIMRSR